MHNQKILWNSDVLMCNECQYQGFFKQSRSQKRMDPLLPWFKSPKDKAPVTLCYYKLLILQYYQMLLKGAGLTAGWMRLPRPKVMTQVRRTGSTRPRGAPRGVCTGWGKGSFEIDMLVLINPHTAIDQLSEKR